MWTSTTGALRRQLEFTKGSSAITTGSTISMLQTDFALDRQYVSLPLAAGSLTAGGTVKAQLMMREFATSDNVDYAMLFVWVVSGDGTTSRGAYLSGAGYGTVGTEFISNTTLRNVKVATTAVTTSYTAAVTIQAGDRLVVEIGAGLNTGLGTTPQFASKWGENATDLPENDTQTTDGAGWIEFSDTIVIGVSAINGTAAAVFDQTGSAKGAGTCVGTSAGVFSQTGSATGSGTLVGTSPAVFGQTFTGGVALAIISSATSAAVFGQAGSAQGAGTLVGTSPAVFSQTGSAQGAGTLGGTSAAVFGQTGTAGGAGTAVGTCSAVFGQTGTLSGTAVCVGTSAAVFSAVGTGIFTLHPVLFLNSTVQAKLRLDATVGAKTRLAASVQKVVRLDSDVANTVRLRATVGSKTRP